MVSCINRKTPWKVYPNDGSSTCNNSARFVTESISVNGVVSRLTSVKVVDMANVPPLPSPKEYDLEQMIKAGLGPSVYALLTENKTNLATTMKNIVVVNEEGKNINQYLGVNKYQMNKIIDFCEKNEHPQHVLMMIGYMKKLFFCGNHMLNEDNAVFDSALTAYSGWYEKHVYAKGNSGALDPNSHWGVIYPGAVHEIVKEFIGIISDLEIPL